jgi:hypothetical protein
MTVRKRESAKTLVAIGGLAIAAAAYMKIVRPWQLRWGATDDEVARTMPGDEVIANPSFDATRAVAIAAPPAHIWPWLVQIGCGRAGWYSYDWVDNLGRPSAEHIIPELQHIQVGDIVPISPNGKQGMFVKAFEPDQWLLWDEKKGDTTWAWGLYPQDGITRLVSRIRIRYDWTSPWILFNLPLDVGDIVMMRKCMLGIKRRAEAWPVAAVTYQAAMSRA